MAKLELVTLTNGFMDVRVSNAFPRVKDYYINGKVLEGQSEAINTLIINDVELKPSFQFEHISKNKAGYILTGDKSAGYPAFEIAVEISLGDNTESGQKDSLNTLTFEVTSVKSLGPTASDEEIVKTIEFPNHSIISINSNENSAQFMGAEIIVNTQSSDGDRLINLDADTEIGSSNHHIAVISNEYFAASIYSNTVTDKNDAWNSTIANITDINGAKHLGLASAEWIYQKGVAYNALSAEEMPLIRVAIVEDVNNDGIVNWNDAAIAHRQIMKNRTSSELVPDTVATRIAMNFGSQAQNPFLVTLDNVKKVFLHTDGLGQNILLKGYGSEGHDSGHLNYADIGERIGGVEDMKTLLSEGKDYGAIFGTHINASETYPESPYFEEERLRKKDGDYSYGWNWLDQAINIDADYDLRHGRQERLEDLAKVLDRGDGKNDLSYLYIDVWGNGQSGDNGTYASAQLAKEIQDLDWGLATEWGYAFANDSILQHWAADVTYGGYKLKGINSKLIRFIQNHERDAWVANIPEYSGAAMNPLLGGYNMKDFEGWQGRNNYAEYIRNLFHTNLSSKFIQHFQVIKWLDGDKTTLPGAEDDISWIPEMEVILENAELDKTLTISRGANDYQENPTAYRTRTMKLDGKTILQEVEEHVNYLIPWYWDANGIRLDSGSEKLYAFSSTGEVNTWELTEEFADVSELYLYKLSDIGKESLGTVAVSDGKITLELEANAAYVLYKTFQTYPGVEWSKHAHIIDTGFNSRNLDAWKIENADSAEVLDVVDTASGTQVLEISRNTATVSLRQEITELTPGRRYAAYVGVENRDDARAFIKISDEDGNQIDYNSTKRSIALNFVKAYSHNTNNNSYTVEEKNPFSNFEGTSYFQNMYVFFDAPETGKTYLAIGKEAGNGTTYFDDIRVFENDMNNFELGENIFFQDFENVPQGIYPFVISGIEEVEDNRTHLSERNPVNPHYTSRGWEDKKVSDVIDGNWSLKTNGLVNRDHLVYQTIPQNYRFKPGKRYRVSLDYLVGSNNTYKFVTGEGNYYKYDEESGEFTRNHFIEVFDLIDTTTNPDGEEANSLSIEFIVEESKENYWIGIYSTDSDAEARGLEDRKLNFSGYRDLIIDNLKIEELD